MSEWWTYTLADFLLFSPATYYRLFELHNRALWPAQLPALAAGVWVLALMRRGDARATRTTAVLLATAWACVGWVFHLERYASINWAAPWFAWAFFAQAVLLLAVAAFPGCATRADRGAMPAWIGFGLAALGMLAMPVLAPLFGRTWAHAEVFAIAPDPTAIVTLGVLLSWGARVRWPLLLVPLAWCAVSGATLLAMRTGAAAVPLMAALAALAVMIATRSSAKTEP